MVQRRFSDGMPARNEIEAKIVGWLQFKRLEGLKEGTLTDMYNRTTRLCRECGYTRLSELDEQAAMAFIKGMVDRQMSPFTIKLQIEYARRFFEWLVARREIEENPLRNCVKPKNYKRNLKKRRRSLTDEELHALIRVASLRPLAEHARRRMSGLVGNKAKFWAEHPINLDNIDDLAAQAREFMHPKDVQRSELDGRKWALTWSVLVHTGLRWNEMRSVRVKQFTYGPKSYIYLSAEQTKNSLEAVQPVPSALADELHRWIMDRDLYANDPIIPGLPDKGIKRFNLDAEAAGIVKEDHMGRSIDIHCLRYTYCTMLAKSGVNMRIVQKLMRHQTIDMTMRVYTDAEQLDHSGAVEVLSALPSVDASRPSPVKPPSKATTPKAEASAAPASGTLSGLPLEMVSQLVGSMDGEAAKKALLAMLGGSASGG